jgi:Zn-dependent peptidase ImmA (M78 family)
MGKIVSFPKGLHPSTRTPAVIRDDVGEIFKMLKAEREHRTGSPVAISELVPTDLFAVMSLLGLRYEELEELGGVRLGNPWAARDATVAGMFTFVTRTVTVAKGQPPPQRRFTTAHEIAHSLYDAGIVQLRERGNSASDRLDPEQKAREQRAEVFAAELLMPTELTRDAMVKRFGSPLDCTVAHDDLAYFLSLAAHQKITPSQLAHMPQVRRAALLATADNFQGKHFVPLAEQFGVSAEAMAKRLLDVDLVT